MTTPPLPPPSSDSPPPPAGPPLSYPTPPPPPAAKKSRGLLYGLLGCGAIFLLVVIAGAVGGGDGKKAGSVAADTPTTTGAPGAPTTEAPPTTQAVGSKANPAPIGTAISPAKDWTVTVNSVELNATDRLFAGNQFNKPDPGTQFVAMVVTVTNGSSKPNSLSSNVKLGLLGSAGIKIDSSFAVNDHPELKPYAQLQPGASVTGELVFEVPEGDIANTVLMAEPTMTLDVVEDQKFLAIQ